jgi:hypothetical protein
MRIRLVTKRSAELATRLTAQQRAGGVRLALCALLATAFVTLGTRPAPAAEQRVALVIGNGAYAQSPLPNTINDARAMTDALGRLGFKVITRLNATQQDMHRAIVEFGEELEKGGVGLFYYAGHAVQIRGKNFMIPVKASISVEDHVEPESVDLNKVIGRMAGARNRLNIVILDACRDNPFGETFQFYAEGLAQTRAPAGTYIAYAAAPGEVAADGTGANSFYTGALARTMPEQGLSIEETFRRVRAAVLKDTKGMQVPWTASSITEDFFFNPPMPKTAEKDGKGADKTVDREVVFWQSIFNSTRPEDFDAYLNQFPSGNFAPLARNRLAELRPRKDVATAAEAKNAPAQASLRTATDPVLLEVIDRAMADAKGDGADYSKQIQAAVEALDKVRRQREDMSEKAEAARKQVLAAVTEKADKGFQDMLAKAERETVAAEEAMLAETLKAAESERETALADAAKAAKAAAAASYAKAGMKIDQGLSAQLAEVQQRAEEARTRDMALANETAYEAHRKAMADAEKAAESMRQRMIASAREKADGTLEETLSTAKRAAEEKAEAMLAKAKAEAEAKRVKELAALESRTKEEEERIVATARQEAEREFEARVAFARMQAAKERERIFADAKKAAETERHAQIAKMTPPTVAKTADESTPTPAELGIGKNVSPQMKRAIDSAMAEARKKGEGREGQMRAALEAIKAYRGAGSAQAKAKGGRPDAATLDAAVAKPELREIIEIAMTHARDGGQTYQGQVQAALDAVKLYRDRETQGGRSPEEDKSQTSALLLGQSQADPELQHVIEDAMTQSRAKGDDYAGQVRAALAAIKAHRAKTADGKRR